MQKENKARYTANTSCGRVGKGGNAGFHTFQLDHHGLTDERMDGRTERRTDGRKDGRTDGRMDGQSLL